MKAATVRVGARIIVLLPYRADCYAPAEPTELSRRLLSGHGRQVHRRCGRCRQPGHTRKVCEVRP